MDESVGNEKERNREAKKDELKKNTGELNRQQRRRTNIHQTNRLGLSCSEISFGIE